MVYKVKWGEETDHQRKDDEDDHLSSERRNDVFNLERRGDAEASLQSHERCDEACDSAKSHKKMNA